MARNFSCFTLITGMMILCCRSVTAQYFYKDIWNSLQLTREMSAFKQQKISAISVKSFDDDGRASQGFFCEEKLNPAYSLSETITRSDVTSQSLLVSYFNSKGLIIKTTDSTESSLNITEYFYNDNDHVAGVRTFTKANGDPGGIGEERSYMYNQNGLLEKMARKKNGTEISTVNFKVDETGNVIEEEEVFKNGKGTKYFYYYDDRNNLTDVVHYFERAKRLLPDYMYEYDAGGQMVQMITTEEGGGYFIWRYTYNDRGLRETERCFSKEKKLVGKVEYSYR